MKLRTKIKFASVAITAIATVSMSVVGYVSVRQTLLYSLNERVQALATAVAAGVDPLALETIHDASSVDTPQYAALEKLVREVTASNQFGPMHIRFIYLLVPTDDHATSGWDIAVDSDPRDSPDWSPPGLPFNPISVSEHESTLIEPHQSARYVQDQWGEWLSGFAPIRTSDGRVVGMVGADIPYKSIVGTIDLIFWIALLVSGLVSAFAYFATSAIINRLMQPLTVVRAFIRKVGQGDCSDRLSFPMTGELALVRDDLNEMATKLGKRNEILIENSRLLDQLGRKQKKLDAIKVLDSQINQIQDIDILMEKILADARALCRCDAGSVYLREGDDLILKYVQNDTPGSIMRSDNKAAVKSKPVPVGHGSIAGYAALSGESVLIADAYKIPADCPYQFNPAFDRASGYRTKGVLTVPLQTSTGKNVGVLQLINPTNENASLDGEFAKDDVETVAHFAVVATIAIERAALTRSIVLRMIAMAELRDPSETAHHVNRVAGFSVLLYRAWAKRRGYSVDRIEHDCDLLRIAAMLHDVGKVGIPDAILKKPGRLTSDEYEVIKTHPRLGAELFAGRDSALDQVTIDVVLHHHERWDGTGYPGNISVGGVQRKLDDDPHAKQLRLAGEDIPIFARVVAVADVFDALSSKRQYKDAWSEQRVLAEMTAHAGKQFDPELIEILLEHMGEMREVLMRYQDEPREIVSAS